MAAISSHVAGQGAASLSPLGVLFGTMINLTAAILVHVVHSLELETKVHPKVRNHGEGPY